MIEERYAAIFAAVPSASAVAHGRVNLIGEHIDYNGGMVLPTTIANATHVAVGPSDDGGHAIYSAQYGEAVRRDLDIPFNGHWSDYIAGALAKGEQNGLIETPMRVVVDSNVPGGAGLSSSASVTVAVLKALTEHAGQHVADVDIARWAQQVEHEFIGVPCGIMDQMAVAIASEKQALALETDTLAHTLITLPDDHHFAVLHSGITRRLDEGRYAERRQECEAAAAALGADWLCQLNEAQVAAIVRLPEVQRKRARHAHSEHRRVLAAIGALCVGDMAAFGVQMDASHASMRDDFEITTPEIDAIAGGAREHGAIGARMTGGGFGGCIVACVPADSLEEWKAAMARDFPATRYIA